MATYVYRNVDTNQMVYVPSAEFAGNPDWELIGGGGSGDAAVVQAELDAHEAASTSTHGIADFGDLETKDGAQAKASAAETAAKAASIPLVQKGQASGVATLGVDSKLTGAQMPVIAAGDIGSGTIAVARLPVGNSAGTVAAGDDGRFTGAVAYSRLPVGTTASTVAAGDATTTALGTKVGKGEQVINVKDHGADGDGTDETTQLNAALAAAVPGTTVLFPQPSTYYSISGPLTVPTGVTVVGAGSSCEIRQTTNLQPVFDLFNASDVTVRGFKLVHGPGSPTGVGGTVRGDSAYSYCAGVWTNGSRQHLSNLRIVNFAMGIYLAATNAAGTVNNDGAQRFGNVIRDVEVSGANHGILFLCQTGLRISGIYSHDHVDSSAGVNPNHAVYGTGTAALTSSDVSISDCVTRTLPFGTAYQVKFINGLAMSNLVAEDCNGLFNGIDVSDATITGLSSRGDTTTGSSAWAFALQRVTSRPIRIAISNVEIHMVAGDGQPMIVIGEDTQISNVSLYSNHSGVSTSSYDLHLRGLRITADGIRIINSGASQYRGVLVGATGYPCSDVTVANLECSNVRTLIDFDTSVSGVNVVDYNPGLQRSVLLGATNFIDQLGGTAAFSISRREWTNTTAITAGAAATPRPPLETVSRFEVGDATAFSVAAPVCRPKKGMVQDITIVNATAGVLGAITWNATYVLRSPFMAPPPGGAHRMTVVYDGTNWREITRSAAADPSGWANSDAVTVGELMPPRERITSNAVAVTSGTLLLTYFTATKTETVATVAAYSGATAAAATPTLIRYGIYSVAATGDLTLVASTPSDTAAFATINTAYPLTLSTPLVKVGGARYAVGLLIVSGATMPSLTGLQLSPTGITSALVRQTPHLIGRLLSQTDLPSSISVGSIAGYQGMPAFQLY